MAAVRASVPVVYLTQQCDEVDPEKKEAAEEAQRQADEARKAAAEAKRKKELERARNQPKPAWYKDLRNPRAGSKDGGTGAWTKIKPGVWNYPTEMGARYQEQISKVARGKEYQVPLDKLTGKPVDFDGWDAARGTYLEAKYGYRGKDFYDAETGELTPRSSSVGRTRPPGRWTRRVASPSSGTCPIRTSPRPRGSSSRTGASTLR